MGEMDLKKAEYYTNRELSWLGLTTAFWERQEMPHFRYLNG